MKRLHIFDHSEYHKALHEQIGNGIPVFNGYRQKGGGLGGILGYIGRYALPLLNKYILPHAKNALINTISDVTSGVPLKSSIKSNATSLLNNVGNHIAGRQAGGNMVRTKRVKSSSISSLPLRSPAKKHCSVVRSKQTKGYNKKRNKKIKKISKTKTSNRAKPRSRSDIFG